MIIRRRALLGMLGLAAMTKPAVSSVSIGHADLLAVNHCVVKWQGVTGAELYYVTVKNLTTKEVMCWTVGATVKRQLKFMVKNPRHVFHASAVAMMYDGVSKNTVIQSMTFHDGDPLYKT